MKTWSKRLFNWFERVYAVPAKRTSIIYAAAGVSILCLTFVSSAVVFSAEAREQANIWVPSHASLTPYYMTGMSSHPMGYILEQEGRRVVCRMDMEGKLYTCVNR